MLAHLYPLFPDAAIPGARPRPVLLIPVTRYQYMSTCTQFFTPAALRTAMELHVPEILRSAGPEVCFPFSIFVLSLAGLHADR